MFKRERAIYLPRISDQLPCWQSPDNCLWYAPGFVTTRSCLERVTAYRSNKMIEHLFQRVLNIRDSNWQDYLEELQNMKSSGDTSIQRVAGIYSHLRNAVTAEEDWATTR